ncbi:Pentatricopeptide repeat-containing protein, partial [Cucurbita argyrosperma subsp. argyrosperma]
MPEASDMEVAKKVFDAMPQRTIIVWNSLISGYEQNGFPSDVGVGLPTRSNDNSELIIFPFSLWARDFGCWLHDYANLNVVFGASLINMYTRFLSACAHSGLIDDAHRVFSSMKEVYVLVPGVEHHVCMVDMFGCAGFLDDAYQFIKKILPEEPCLAVWTSMLGACRRHKKFDLGAKVAKHVSALDPEKPGIMYRFLTYMHWPVGWIKWRWFTTLPFHGLILELVEADIIDIYHLCTLSFLLFLQLSPRRFRVQPWKPTCFDIQKFFEVNNEFNEVGWGPECLLLPSYVMTFLGSYVALLWELTKLTMIVAHKG